MTDLGATSPLILAMGANSVVGWKIVTPGCRRRSGRGQLERALARIPAREPDVPAVSNGVRTLAPGETQKTPPGTQPSGGVVTTELGMGFIALTLQTRRSGGRRRQAAIVSSAMTSAIVLCSGKTQLPPAGTSRAAIADSTSRQAPWAGKPITASLTRAQAPQVFQVVSE
jgi:hypothetical protein